MSDASPGEGWWLASDGNWYPPEQHASHAVRSAPAVPADAVASPVVAPISWVAIGGIAAAVLGSFMPWAQAGFFSVDGTDGDGTLTLIAGAIAGALYGYYLKQTSTRNGQRIAALTLMAVAALIYVYDFVNISSLVDDSALFTVTPGTGLYVGSLGSIAAVVAMVVELRRERRGDSPTTHG